MTLPASFANSFDYMKESIEFLEQYSWIYREANTCYLKAGILNEMPMEFKNYFIEIDNEQLNRFPYVYENFPQNTKYLAIEDFRSSLKKLIPADAFAEVPQNIEVITNTKIVNFRKMNLKKQHEIQRLALKIKKTLQENEMEMGATDATTHDDDNKGNKQILLIDFGSGLGYLSQQLYHMNNKEAYFILGLEADLQRVQTAEQRLQQFMPNATNHIKYQQQFITEDSKGFIEETIAKLFKSNYQTEENQKATATENNKQPQTPSISAGMSTLKTAIIGLHACADLTITSMKLFLTMPHIHYLLIMPCCYHKMQMATDTTGSISFANFPLSNCLKLVLNQYDNERVQTFLNRPFLRLACQQTLKRWSQQTAQEHRVHGENMFLRAIAEYCIASDEIVEKCKEGHADASLNKITFEYLSQRYAVKSKVSGKVLPWSTEHKKNFEDILERYAEGSKLAEGLTCLQTAMQKLCENLVLYDRLCYMKEKAKEEMQLKLKIYYEKLMDEELSPRCYVMVAQKL